MRNRCPADTALIPNSGTSPYLGTILHIPVAGCILRSHSLTGLATPLRGQETVDLLRKRRLSGYIVYAMGVLMIAREARAFKTSIIVTRKGGGLRGTLLVFPNLKRPCCASRLAWVYFKIHALK